MNTHRSSTLVSGETSATTAITRVIEEILRDDRARSYGASVLTDIFLASMVQDPDHPIECVLDGLCGRRSVPDYGGNSPDDAAMYERLAEFEQQDRDESMNLAVLIWSRLTVHPRLLEAVEEKRASEPTAF